ncbi:MAG: class I SAM-dependent methyltransferase [Alphaproteobacteria bacterium]|nr:class I SAM-dependent methyltransferase [Alphaproteobacteria bacterium]
MNFITNKISPSKQKLRGGYYTPIALAQYLCDWAVRSNADRVLEPSCGDGNFLIALSETCKAKKFKLPVHVTAIEIDHEEIESSKIRTKEHKTLKTQWINGDFFTKYEDLKKRYDVVIGNPPFIRFQYFDPDSREIAFSHLREKNYSPTKLANAWCAFVQLSIEKLKKDGRLALVVPAELLQVKYAGELRERITKVFDHVVLVTFKELVFDGIQQEVILLLCEGKRSKEGDHTVVHTVELKDTNSLLSIGHLDEVICHQASKHARKGLKWTALYLNDDEFQVLDNAFQHEKIQRLGKLASVEVGIVTGRNSFFVLKCEDAKRLGVVKYCRPIVGRTTSLKSTNFVEDDFKKHALAYPSLLLDLSGVPQNTFSKDLLNYLKNGENEGVNLGYKCRIRKRWFDVPSIYVPDGFMFRQVHEAPLIVTNQTVATTTDTIHRVRVKADVEISRISSLFCNSLTFAWAEICGRSYGGGVLELEPREAEELPIPICIDLVIDTKELDHILKTRGVEMAVDWADPQILGQGLGFSNVQIKAINACWKKLRDRRMNRH